MNSEIPQSEHSLTLRESLVARIQEQEVRMIPRLYFVLKLVGLIALIALIVAVSILISNFIFFNLRVNGHEALLAFGGRGILLFLQFFPWELLIIDLILIVVLRYVLKEFSFGYKIPWIPMVIALLLISGVSGALIDRATPFNDALLRQADEGHLPGPVGAAFQEEREPPQQGQGEYRGRIVSIEGNQIVIATSTDPASVLRIQLPPRGPGRDQAFTIGESVGVLGDIHDGVVDAVGIHPLDPNGLPPR